MADENQAAEAEDTQTEDTAAAPEAAAPDSGAPKADAVPEQKPDAKAEQPEEKPEPTDWRAGIEDKELRDLAGRYTTPADLAKAVKDMRSELSQRIKIPGKKASEEEVAAYRKAIGVPEDASKYEFTLPEGKEATEADKAFQGKMAEVFHQANVSADQAKVLNEAWNEMTAAAEAEQVRQMQAYQEESRKALDKEWGSDKDANYNLAVRAFKNFGGSEDLLNMQMEGGGRLGDNADFLRMFATVGRRMGEGQFIGAVGSEEKSTIQDQIDTIMRDNPPGTAKYNDPKVQQKLRALNEQLYGSEPIVGQGGRSA